MKIPNLLDENAKVCGILVDTGEWVLSPTVRQMANLLGLQTAPLRDRYDVVEAGVYGASEGLRILLLERFAAGGQAGASSRIENYLGFPSGLSGDDLSNRALKQAKRFGAEIALTRCIESLERYQDRYCVSLDDGQRVEARSVILTTGVERRRLNIPGLDSFLGRGVLCGASRTEALGVVGKQVFMVGGGNSAGQAAMFFSGYAAQVTILLRGAELGATMSQYLIDQLASKSNISVEPFTEVTGANGTEQLQTIETRTRRSGEADLVQTRNADALFIMIGADARTAWLPAKLERDEKGYVCTGLDLKSWPLSRQLFPLETSLPGVFCAGDIRHASTMRVASSVGEGSMAIAFVHQYLALTETARPLVAKG